MTKRRWFLRRWLLRRWVLLFALAALVSTGWFVSESGGLKTSSDGVLAQTQQAGFESKKIVPFVPTPQEVVEGMLELAQVKKGDVVYDLGSGDGRIVITAAAKKYGAQAVGFEIDPERITESRESIGKEGLEKLAEIREQDILTVDLSQANVLTMYLLSSVNLKLRPKILSEMAPGSRVVSHAFDMGDWKPDKVVQINGSAVYYWTVPQRGSFRN